MCTNFVPNVRVKRTRRDIEKNELAAKALLVMNSKKITSLIVINKKIHQCTTVIIIIIYIKK